jgi:hypothetical protein
MALLSVTCPSEPADQSYWNPCMGRYSNLWYTLVCASSSIADFKYLVQVNYCGLTAGSVTQSFPTIYAVPPRPVTGNGFFDSHEAISSLLSYDLQPTLAGFGTTSNSAINTNINYGFSFNPGLTFSDTLWNAGNWLGLTFSQAHGLTTNDIIVINKNNKTLNGQYDGTASVTSTTTYSIITDRQFGSSSVAETGLITSLTRWPSISYTTTFTAFNATRQYNQVALPFDQLYTQNYSQAPFLTNYPFNVGTSKQSAKKVFTNDNETLSFINDGTDVSNSVYTLTVNTYNNDPKFGGATAGGTAYYAYNPYIYGWDSRVDVGVGPNNLKNIGIMVAGYNYYKVSLGTASSRYCYGSAVYNIVDNCSPWTNIRIAFLNKLGGFDYMNFNYKSKNTIQTEKTMFKRQLSPGYSVGQREDTVLSTKSYDLWTASTEWITEAEGTWLKELIQSPEAYIVDDTNNTTIPIIVSDTSYEVKSQLLEKLFCFTLNYKMAFQTSTQGN